MRSGYLENGPPNGRAGFDLCFPKVHEQPFGDKKCAPPVRLVLSIQPESITESAMNWRRVLSRKKRRRRAITSGRSTSSTWRDCCLDDQSAYPDDAEFADCS
jgi:hypothetical protein